MTSENLETKYRLLLSRKIQGKNYRDHATFLYFLAGWDILYAFTQSFHILSFPFLFSTSSTLVLILVGLTRRKKSLTFEITRKEKPFFSFYKAYDKLVTHLADPQNKENEIVAKRSIEQLANFIDLWITEYTPKELAEIPESLGLHLHSFSSLMPNEKTMFLKDFLLKAASSSASQDPTIVTLRELNESIKSLFPISVSQTLTISFSIRQKNKIIEFLREGSKWAYILAGSVFMIFLTIIQILPSQIASSITNISMGVVVIAGFLIYLYDKKKKTKPKS